MFAFIGGQWPGCFADQYAQVYGRSEREWLLILDEWRAQQQKLGKKRVVFKETLAPLLEALERLQVQAVVDEAQHLLNGEPHYKPVINSTGSKARRTARTSSTCWRGRMTCLPAGI